MTQEFERSKERIGPHSIMVTSWYDDQRKTWRASAPAYAYLHTTLQAADAIFRSRKEAVANITGLLAKHLGDA